MAKRCQHPGGITIKPDGIHTLLPCRYDLKEVHRNVTVRVHQCCVCGHIDIDWIPQDDSEHIIYGELGPEPDD